jgi:hypothetical protein
MTRTDESEHILDRDNVSKAFASRYNEHAVAKRLSGEAITAHRGCKLNSNNETQVVSRLDSSVFGVPTSTAGHSATEEGLYTVFGPTKVTAAGARIEAQQEFKFGYAGKIHRFIKSSPARAILAATAGESGEITDSDANDETLTVSSASASDTDIFALCIGKEATTGNALYEFIEVTGTTANAGSESFDELYAVILLDEEHLEGSPTACVGNITVINTTSETTLVTITATGTHMGAVLTSEITNNDCYDRRFYATISALAAEEIVVIGYDNTHTVASEIITWAAANDILKKESSNRYNKILWLAHGDINDARTVTYAAALGEDLADGWTNNVGNVTYTVGNQPGTDNTVEIISDESTDDCVITLLGATQANAAVVQDVTCTGDTAASVGTDIAYVYGAFVKTATTGTAGAISIRQADDTVIGVFDTATYNSWGLVEPDGGDAGTTAKTNIDLDGGNDKLSITSSNASATDVAIIYGLDRDGSSQAERVAMVSGTIEGSSYWSKIICVACVDQATTEHIRLHNANDETGKPAGIVVEPSDSADDNIEVFLK